MQILYLTVLSLSAFGHVAAVQYTSSSSGSNSTTISTPTTSQSSGSAPPTFEFLFAGQIPEAGRFCLDGPVGRRDDVPFAKYTSYWFITCIASDLLYF
ncbi:hypothetical protein C8Q75DRAFT_755614 [Abortiporus biennis]|nr:hypothetical protein C8Q75DRAFT_755614 [Abortiporus biennis]